jgi:two-component system cell cycle response regulator
MRIVLVEPSRTIRRIVSDMIESWDHEVWACAHAHEALSRIKSDQDVRALITSAELTSTSGFQLVAQARDLIGDQRALYIILMSSTDEYTKCIQALDHGADDFICKPPVAEELRARLRTADRVTTMQRELIRLAATDFLTGLSNRRSFFENGFRAVERAQRGQALAVIIFDLDHFKRINDLHGHDVGDTVLKRVAVETSRLPGIAGRLGGEEFGVLLESELSDAVDVANVFRRSIERLRIFSGEQSLVVTCSLGVTEWEAGDTIDTLLRRADMALYEAKTSGRNKVVAADAFALSEQNSEWRGTTRVLRRHS